MNAASKLLLLYGVLSLTYGFLLGLPITMIRMKAPVAPRHLVIAHLAAIIQGAVHLGLASVLRFTTLSNEMELLAAVLLVTGSFLFVSGATANWLKGVGDHFAARSFGWKLLAGSGAFHLTGILVILYGAVTSL